MQINSIRFKISVLYTIVLGLTLLAYSTLLYFNLSYVLYNEIDKNLKKKAQEIVNTINDYSKILEPDQEDALLSLRRVIHLYDLEKEELLQWPKIKKIDRAWKDKILELGINHDYIVVFNPSGEVIDKSRNVEEHMLPILKKNLQKISLKDVQIEALASRKLHLRIITRPFVHNDKLKYIIQVAFVTNSVTSILKNKFLVIFITIFMVLLLTSAFGSFFVTRIFEPITEITKTARAISYKDMNKRVEEKFKDEEIKSLVGAFNDMISRLESSFRYIEEFSSNVAHELKTPLAIIRGESELALRKERNPEEYKKAIKASLDETQRMLKIINDLLLLTRLDYAPEAFGFERFDLTAFLLEIYEQSKIFASQKDIFVGINISQEPLNINGNRLQLRRLFLNLIDNAIKFTKKEGKIDIIVKHDGRKAVIAISDTGIGIKEEDLPKIFNRFFHIDMTGENMESSSGLGLNIVKSIAKMHYGSVEVKSQPGKGSTFTVELPLA